MKNLLLILTAILLALPAPASPKARILPFKVWKQKKVDEAKSIVNDLKREMKKISGAKTIDEEENKEDIVRKLYQAELNLGVVKELSANDYFVLYVTPQFKNSPDVLNQAAKTLKAKDVADILSAYQKKLQAPDVLVKTAPPGPYDETEIAPSPTASPL